MFDIGFAELILIGVVGLLVIGPERLPETIRTASMWLNRLKRSFNDIKREVEQELHNDAVLQDLRKTSKQLKDQAEGVGREVQNATSALTKPVAGDQPDGAPPDGSPPDGSPPDSMPPKQQAPIGHTAQEPPQQSQKKGEG